MRVIFLGTPEFAVDCLEALTHSKHEIVGVVTQPDKPSERGNKVQYSPVKVYAQEHKLPLFQFPKISRDGVIDLKTLKPDIMVTAAYGQILSQEVLDIATYGVINVHASLLPKYRGASPIQTAILNGDTETGVTIMKTESGLDTGDIICAETVPIYEDETAGELSVRLAKVGAVLLLKVLENFENHTVQYIQQDHFNATITKKITKEDCVIHWDKSTREIKSLIQCANPNPIARTYFGNDIIKIYRAKTANFELSETDKNLPVGTVLEESSAKLGLFVKTGDGILEITEMQLSGGKILPAKTILSGRKIKPLDSFGTVQN